MTIFHPDTEAALLEAVFDELGVDPTQATDAQKRVALRRLGEAMTKVLSFLNREDFDVATITVPELWRDESYAVHDLRTWQPVVEFSDRARYISHVPNVEDATLSDVTFEVGLSLENPEAKPILDVLVADAAEGLLGHVLFPTAPLTVKSVSGGGQSMSWDTRKDAPDATGGKLNVAVLGRFKRFNVGVSPTPTVSRFGYGWDRGR